MANGKFVVGVIGAQNTGKSTFIHDIIEKFKGTPDEFHTVGCDYREKIRKAGLQINRDGNLEAQKIILDTLVEQLDIIKRMPDGNYITDRSPIDAYVYTMYLYRHKPELSITQADLAEMLDRVKNSIGGYDRIVYIDLNNCTNVQVVDDTFRDTNLEYRQEIDWLFKDTLLKLVLSGVLPANKVSDSVYGTREERLSKFIEVIGAQGVFDATHDSAVPTYPDPVQTTDKMYEYGYRVTDKYVFFYGSFLSNFARCKFVWEYMGESHEFFCTEQAFMWAKARFFNDPVMSKAILDEKDDPMECKHCGRWVQGYDDEKWAKVRYDIMRDVNFARFSQYSYHHDKILDPEFDGKTFVEASPSDGIWGIKMGIKDKGTLDERNWRGQNLLGKALTEVRERLLALEDESKVV